MSDQAELSKIRESIEGLCADEGPVKMIQLQMARIVSHLESEQRVRNAMFTSLTNHELVLHGDRDKPDKYPGIISDMRDIKRIQTKASKAMWLIAGALIPLLVSAVWQAIAHPLPGTGAH